jgi:hypothetical protein
MLRRTALVVAVVFLASNRGWKFTVVSLLNVLVLMIHMLARPFRSWLDNMMELMSLCFLTLLSLLLRESNPPVSDTENVLVMLAWIVPLVLMVMWIIVLKLHKWGRCPDRWDGWLAVILVGADEDVRILRASKAGETAEVEAVSESVESAAVYFEFSYGVVHVICVRTITKGMLSM